MDATLQFAAFTSQTDIHVNPLTLPAHRSQMHLIAMPRGDIGVALWRRRLWGPHYHSLADFRERGHQ
jgi:hypothetical protein